MNPFLEIEGYAEKLVLFGFFLGFTCKNDIKIALGISDTRCKDSIKILKEKNIIYQIHTGHYKPNPIITLPSPPVALPSPPVALPSPPVALSSPPVALPSPPVALSSPPVALPAESAVNQLTNLISSQQTIGNFENEELRKRIEMLEQQNAFLMQLLQKQQSPQIITDSPSVSGSFFGSARKPSFSKQQQETAPADNSPDEPPTGKTKYRGTTENLLDQIPRQYEEAFRSAMQEVIDYLVKTSREQPHLADKLDYRKISPAIFHRLAFLRVRYIAGERNLALPETDWRAMINDDCKATFRETRIKFIGAAFLKTLQEFYIRENWEWTAVYPPSVEFKQEKYEARLHNRPPRVWAFPNENTRQKEQERNKEPELFARRIANQATVPPAEPQPPKYVEVVAQIEEKEKQDEQTTRDAKFFCTRLKERTKQ